MCNKWPSEQKGHVTPSPSSIYSNHQNKFQTDYRFDHVKTFLPIGREVIQGWALEVFFIIWKIYNYKLMCNFSSCLQIPVLNFILYLYYIWEREKKTSITPGSFFSSNSIFLKKLFTQWTKLKIDIRNSELFIIFFNSKINLKFLYKKHLASIKARAE